jgi:hypothetical protein
MLLTAIALGLMLGCPKKQINTGGTGYGFETKRIYTIAVFPVSVRGSASLDELQRDSAYTYLVDCLEMTGRFEMVDQVLSDNAVDQPGALSKEKARSLGKDLGADVVCLTEINVKQATPPVVLARVDIFPVSGNSPSYTGSGQAKDPASLLAAARLALDSATAKIVQ